MPATPSRTEGAEVPSEDSGRGEGAVFENPTESASPSGLMGLRGQILAIALLPMMVVAVVLAIYFSHHSISALETALERRGADLARHLADTAGYDLYAGQPVYLKRLLDYERTLKAAEAIGISDAQDRWWLVSGHASLLAKPRMQVEPGLQREGPHMHFTHPILLHAWPDGQEPSSPSEVGHELVGQVTVTISREGIDTARSEIITATLSLLAVLLGSVGLLAWRLSTRLSHPLNRITEAVQDLAGGALDTRVDATSTGELGSLERGVNSMAEALESSTRHLEQRIHDATAGLLAQKEAADAATMAKSRFLAAASHDLRQPLHALKLLVSALRDTIPAKESESQWLLNNIEQANDTMENLLGTLLDLSRLDAGVVVARPTCFRVNDLFDRLELQFKPLAEDKGLELRIHRCRLAIFSDPQLLERVLANLISNAIRYTERGGILIGLRRVQHDWARIEVRDTGKGIPAEFRKRIFEEYFQLDNPERDREKGLGLGLAIVMRLTRLLGSSIDVMSTPGRGSCFSVRATRCAPPPYSGRITEELVPMPLHDTLVAFIDDDQAILEAMLALFDQWGVELATGPDAVSVREDLQVLGRGPDIIISDFRLRHGRTGLEAVAELRAAFGPDIPAILITGDTSPDTIQALDQTGHAVLYKPLQPARLRALLSHVLAKRRDRRNR